MPSHENFVPFGTTGKKSKRSQIPAGGGRMLDAAFPQYAEQSPPTSDKRPAFMRPSHGDRWSIWDASLLGEGSPCPYPDWLVTELAAVDTELGVTKSGKEADVFLTLVRSGR
ncbi:hypothetical protein ACWY4P_00875 [Streptomyces sp. LZ34]